MMRISRTNRHDDPCKPGYILLISILMIGAIASAVLSSLLILGTSAGQISATVKESSAALALAQGCAEYALMTLHQSPTYAGNEIRTLPTGTCEVLTVGGIGNTNRSVCTEGKSGDAIRRLEIAVSQLLPQAKILSWQEVSVFSLCE